MEAVRSKGQGFPENSTVVMSKVPQNSEGGIFFPRNGASEPAQSPAREQELTEAAPCSRGIELARDVLPIERNLSVHFLWDGVDEEFSDARCFRTSP